MNRAIYILDGNLRSIREKLICDDGSKIFGIDIQSNIKGNYKQHYLTKSYEHCDKQKGKELKDYFFTSSKNPNYNTTYETIRASMLKPGLYHPRIYRPLIIQDSYSTHVSIIGILDIVDSRFKYDYLPHNEKSLIQSLQQLSTLNNRLISIFNNIYPNKKNYNSYGHEIRNLLILACTEVENQWKGIMVDNNIPPSKSFYTTVDYVKLNKVLKLDEYSVKLAYFPDSDIITPFKGWSISGATTTISWYASYNAVKHGREDAFDKATLINAINAVCAVVILLFAQYGVNINRWNELIGSFFEIEKAPVWDLEESYLPPFENEEWYPVNVVL